MELGAFRRKLASSNTSKGRKPKGKAAKGRDDDRIALHARKFCVLNEIFVPDAAFLTRDPNFDPMDPERYRTADSIRNGIIAELFEEVPDDLHEPMQESGSFRDMASRQYYDYSLLTFDHTVHFYTEPGSSHHCAFIETRNWHENIP